MILIKKTFKPSLTKTKTKSYLFSCENHKWQIEQDPVTDLWNIYLQQNEARAYIDSRAQFKTAKSFVALNATYILKKYL